MSLNKKPVIRVIIVVVVCALVFIALAAYRSFARRYAACNAELNKMKAESAKNVQDYQKAAEDYKKIAKENIEIKNNYAKLEKDFQNLSADRESILAQSRGLLADRNLARELEGKLDKVNKDLEALKKEKQGVLEQNSGLKEGIKKLEQLHKQVIKQKDDLEDEIAKSKDAAFIKRLEKEKAAGEKENKDLAGRLKQQAAKMDNLEDALTKTQKDLAKSKIDIDEREKRLDKFNADYNEAVKKNRMLEEQTVELPRKFAELARQNKALIKQTATMHYNLGIFYTKNKEYSRAIAEFEKAIELNPDDAYAHFNLGYIYAEFVVSRPKAIEHFRHFLRLAKKDDKDVDWVKKYLITWQAWDGKEPMN